MSISNSNQISTMPAELTDKELLGQLLQISRNFVQIRDTQELLNYAVDEVMRLVGAERGYIVLVYEDILQTVPSVDAYLSMPNAIEFQVRRRSDGTDIYSDEDLISRNVLCHVLEERSALVSEDALTDIRFANVESVISLNLRSIMCVPLIFQSERIGAIYVENRTIAKQFSADNLAPLEYFSHQVAVVIHRLRLDQEHQRLQEQYFQSQKIEALGQLSSGMAHEFNNLLVPIIAYVEMSKMRLPEDSQIYSYIEKVHDCALRAESLIDQILAYTRQTVVAPEPVHLEEVVSGFSELLKGLLEDSIEIEILLEETRSVFLGSKNQIEQLLLNLALNARDAMEGRGKLTIETKVISQEEWATIAMTEQFFGTRPPSDNYVALRVHDTGCGINEKEMMQIFEPFFTTKGPDAGTGLGLATVFAISQQHRGYISVASEIGVGSIFSVYLPQTDQSPAVHPKKAQDVKATVPSKSILVVDDNDAVREAICAVLLEYNYRVREANTPQKALKILKQNPSQIDLVITDLMMPQSNGYELYQQIKEIAPGVDVLLMSGYANDVLAKYGVASEEINFIQKPFSPEALVAKVHESTLVN